MSALAAKTGEGEKKRPLLPMPPPPPTGGGDTPEIEEFRCRRPGCDVFVDRAALHGLTDAQGRRRGGSLVDYNDDDDSGDDDDDNDWGRRGDA
jgi:hypothetical protein